MMAKEVSYHIYKMLKLEMKQNILKKKKIITTKQGGFFTHNKITDCRVVKIKISKIYYITID